VTDVAVRLERAGRAILTMHKLSIDAHQDDSGNYSIAIQAIALATFRDIEARLGALTGAPFFVDGLREFDA
jgi:hypothetical protein